MAEALRDILFDEGDEPEDYEPDSYEEAMANCCGHFDGKVFICGAAGSEDCDWDCPFSRDLGLTLEQIEERDATEMLAEERSIRETKGNAEYDSWVVAIRGEANK